LGPPHSLERKQHLRGAASWYPRPPRSHLCMLVLGSILDVHGGCFLDGFSNNLLNIFDFYKQIRVNSCFIWSKESKKGCQYKNTRV
jgi:hypothetical protein